MSEFGNQITANAFSADEGTELVRQGLEYVKEATGWAADERQQLFQGVYYDSKKVGSYLAKAFHANGQTAVVKLQLRPLPHDEGRIIRHISQQIRTSNIRLPRILADMPWNSNTGFGYCIFEDLSHIPDLWTSGQPTQEEMHQHKLFLKDFLHNVLSVESWLPKPMQSMKERYYDLMQHFYAVAENSSHHHIADDEVERYKIAYGQIFEGHMFSGVHFTHGHLSGKDIKFNRNDNHYILMANLLWSYRPMYYEIVFPMWVDLMHVRDKNLNHEQFHARVDEWKTVFADGLYDHNPCSTKQFLFEWLTRCVLTIVLDLGASEWGVGESEEKQALLNCWKREFEHTIHTYNLIPNT